MYARSTTIRGNPDTLDQGIAYVRDEVMPAVQGMSGCVGLSMLVDRQSGRCIVTTAWADESAMHATEDAVRSMRERAAEMFGSQPEVAEWEIGILHRRHEAPDGAWCRVTWMQGDPANIDEMLGTVRMAIIPRVDEISGFCSLSVMVDRNSGRCALAGVYDTRDALEASSATVAAMRQQFTEQMHVEVTDMAEFELVLAHLRVPETV